MLRATALALTIAILGAPAWADDGQPATRPPIRPTRDVDVTYEIPRPSPTGGEQILSERMRWDVAGNRMRVDPPTTGVYMLMDYGRHRLIAVKEADRTFVEVDSGDATGTPGIGRGAPFRKMGAGTVAGVPCTEWDTRDSGGQPVLVCMTDDGVLLRARSVDRLLITATRVDYGSADPAEFSPPPGFKRVRSEQP